jgi:hypothetical protein
MVKIRFKVAAVALLTVAMTMAGTPVAYAQCSGSADGCPYGQQSRGDHCTNC